MQSWSLIVFFYNEEGNIKKICKQALDFLNPLPLDKKELIFVNDGSIDKTVKYIKQALPDQTYIKFVNHKKNLGIGASLKTAYKTASMENICAVPGDGQFDLNELRAFRNIASNTVISFFRISHPSYSIFRILLTKASQWVNRIFFSLKLRDINWIKVYKKSSLKSLDLKSKSHFVESEICFLLKNTHVLIESPSYFLKRQSGVSKSVNVLVLIKVFIDILRLFLFRLISKLS